VALNNTRFIRSILREDDGKFELKQKMKAERKKKVREQDFIADVEIIVRFL
jgi:hypothetical protein